MNRLKRYAVVRRLASLGWRHFYPSYAKFAAILCNKKARRWVNVIKLADFAKRKSSSSWHLLDAEQVEISEPPVYPSACRDILGSFVDQYTFPRLFIAGMDNVGISGGTNLVLLDGAVLCHDLYDFTHDYTSEELHGRAAHDPGNRRVRWLLHDAAPKKVPACATFVDACAVNYAHWLTEVLPRIALFCMDERFKDIPIVVNDGLHENIMESLFVVKADDREVITLPIGRVLEVDELYVTSATGYVPFEPRKGGGARMRRGEFSPYALSALRKRIHSLLLEESEGIWPEKIYLRRNAQARRVTNAADLENLVVSRDFVIIEPEKLTFRMQAQLFMHAKVVVGATGAAFVNTLFCQPGAKVAILVAQHKELAYEYWVNMLMPIGVDVSYILGKSHENEIHSDFEIDLAHLTEFLDDLDEGKREEVSKRA
ncbi:MAG: glycosyltransferase family 61 protein [Nitrosomonadales bacterium]|nr:glycosyltransferase family 61 protein [Nitrosomonadales bacterium]